eukprot:CAMPEP_0179914616 /NCGR_PEP_ID=MMETSP0983-20121128/1183_1 /TAXON_ID=483367 /ORGANISM="non described non described, Strain CCMP 2436" /LENGTH=99 /DNA_ID=CAMNT_0021816873 /DNA_START=20 /DNA_END=317 /DNA_ORIENTATION=+
MKVPRLGPRRAQLSPSTDQKPERRQEENEPRCGRSCPAGSRVNLRERERGLQLLPLGEPAAALAAAALLASAAAAAAHSSAAPPSSLADSGATRRLTNV